MRVIQRWFTSLILCVSFEVIAQEQPKIQEPKIIDCSSFNIPSYPLTGKILRLDDAIMRASLQAPVIQIAAWEIANKENDTVTAGLRPNPSFNLDIGPGGDGACANNNNCSAGSVSYSIEQEFELGGKRCARVAAADGLEQVSFFDYQIAIRNVQFNVISAYLKVYAIQLKLCLAEEHRRIAENVQEVVSAKVSAGKLPSLQESKAKVAVAATKIHAARTKRQYENAKKQLAVLMGSVDVDFECVDYLFYQVREPIAFETIASRLIEHPSVIKKDAEIDAGYSAISLARANAVPDLTVEAGVKQDSWKGDEFAFFINFSIPIPISDRNQGNIAKAYSQIYQTEYQRQQLLLDLESQLHSDYQDMTSAYDVIIDYKDQVLVEAMDAFEQIQTRFEQGKHDYLEVLDTQRSMFTAQEQYVDYLLEYHLKQAELKRLVTNW
jgi:cobalt-zinc-cadmium efflux system outer membrane protein